MNRRFLSVMLILLSFTIRSAEAQTIEYDTDRGFVHPGGLHTQEDFDRVKRQLAEGNEKVTKAYNILKSAEYAQPSVQTYPTEIIVRGGGVGENYMNAARGAAMAYQNALRWKIEDNTACANAAVRILMQWARTTKGIGGDSNYALASGIYGYQFAQAAELMRDYEGWKPEEFAQFKQWMLDVWYPPCIGFLRGRNGTWENAGLWWQAPGTYWSNWGLTNALCVMSIGILCDDVFIYNQGLSFIKYDQCGTFKNPRTEVPILNDGLTEFMGNFVVTTYESELETGAYGRLGQLNESGRDAGHSAMSLGVMLDVAKVAWSQGDDLFAYMDHRLAAGVEYLAAQALSVEGLPWVDYHYCDSRFHYIDSRSWLMTAPAMGAQMRPYWGTVIGIYEGVKGVAMPFAEQAYNNMGIDGGGQGSTSGGYDHLGYSVLMNTYDTQLCPAELTPTELMSCMEYSTTPGANLIPSLANERQMGNVDGQTIRHNELGGLVNTYTTNTKTSVPKGRTLTLMPQLPEGEEDTGKWSWNTGETTRNITINTDRSYIYRVTYTNSKGIESRMAFSIAVEGDCIPVKLTPESTYNGVTTADTIVNVLYGKTCELSVTPSCGWGTYKWSSGESTQSITTATIRTPKDYTVSYTNQGAAVATCTFHIVPVPAEPYILHGTETLQATEIIVEEGDSLTLGLTLPAAVPSSRVVWNTEDTGRELKLGNLQTSATYTATFTLGGEERTVAFIVYVKSKEKTTLPAGNYCILEAATGHLLTSQGKGVAVTFEEGDTENPAEGQIWFIEGDNGRHSFMNHPDSLYLTSAGKLSGGRTKRFYIDRAAGTDFIALYTKTSSSSTYWDVTPEGTIDMTATTLTGFPFLLVPVKQDSGIDGMPGNVPSETEAVYTLQGQKVTSPFSKGIYIINRRKVVVK